MHEEVGGGMPSLGCPGAAAGEACAGVGAHMCCRFATAHPIAYEGGQAERCASAPAWGKDRALHTPTHARPLADVMSFLLSSS